MGLKFTFPKEQAIVTISSSGSRRVFFYRGLYSESVAIPAEYLEGGSLNGFIFRFAVVSRIGYAMILNLNQAGGARTDFISDIESNGLMSLKVGNQLYQLVPPNNERVSVRDNSDPYYWLPPGLESVIEELINIAFPTQTTTQAEAQVNYRANGKDVTLYIDFPLTEPNWPSYLYPTRSGFSLRLQDGKIRSGGVGPPSERERLSVVARLESWNVILTQAEYISFQTFWRTESKMGAVLSKGKDPASLTNQDVYLRIQSIGQTRRFSPTQWIVSLQVEILPKD